MFEIRQATCISQNILIHVCSLIQASSILKAKGIGLQT